MKMNGYTFSRGRFCHAVTSGIIFSVIFVIRSGEISTSYNSLEPIPKLAMDAQEFTPDNGSTGKLQQGHVVGGFLFITDQKFAESIEKRVCNLDDPATGAEVGVAFQLLFLLAAWPNVWNITVCKAMGSRLRSTP